MKKLIIFLILMINIFSESKKILIIGSYHKEYQFQIEYINEIKNVVGKNYDYFNFYMDTKHIKKEEFIGKSNEAFAYYKKLNPDLVVLGDDSAFSLLKDRFAKETVPIVFLGINNNLRNYFKIRPNNFTGVLERPLYQRNITFIKECIPQLKKILILYDNGNTSQFIVKEAFSGKKSGKILNVEMNIVNTDSYEKWQDIVLNESKKYDAVVLGLYSTLRDKNDKVINENFVLQWTSKNIKKPLFGTWSFSVGNGKTIGGLVLSGKDQGNEAGKIIKKILEKNEKPISIYPVTALNGEYLLSQFELNRWNIVIPDKYKEQVKFIE